MAIENRIKADGGRVRAVGMVSGGLDSTLAVRLIHEQGIEVLAVWVDIGFSPGSPRWSFLQGEDGERTVDDTYPIGDGLSVPLLRLDLRERFQDILLAPKHGYGGNMNPCIDCHSFMMTAARELIAERGFDFIFTGEVLGQRPMSQHLRALHTVARSSGLPGKLLRPLSARNLDPTEAELNGWVERELLLGITGRSRKVQMELARRYGILDYPSPAGGCMLTEPIFSSRLHDLLKHQPPGVAPPLGEIMLLKVGRHFRLSPGLKLVVGRDESENLALERIRPDALQLEAVDFPGPTAILTGRETPDPEQLKIAAAITGRYGKGRDQRSLKIRLRDGAGTTVLNVSPSGGEREIDRWRIAEKFDSGQLINRGEIPSG